MSYGSWVGTKAAPWQGQISLRVHTEPCSCHSSVNILALVEAPNTSWRLRSCNARCRNPWECVSKSVYLLSLLFFLLNNKIFTGSNATWFTIGINWTGCFKDFLSVDHGHWKMPEFRVLKYYWVISFVGGKRSCQTKLTYCRQWIFLKSHSNLCISIIHSKPYCVNRIQFQNLFTTMSLGFRGTGSRKSKEVHAQ